MKEVSLKNNSGWLKYVGVVYDAIDVYIYRRI